MTLVQFVIGINVAIALIGFYLAWRVWRVKQSLTSTTVALTAWERSIHRVATSGQMTAMMQQSQRSTALTRERYRKLRSQLRQLQRVFGVAVVVLRLWQRGLARRSTNSRNQ